MPSLLARFRHRTGSTSAGSSSSNSSSLPKLPETDSSPGPPPPVAQDLQLARKIHPNLNELIGSFEEEGEVQESYAKTGRSLSVVGGLSPSRRRHSADSSTLPWTFQPREHEPGIPGLLTPLTRSPLTELEDPMLFHSQTASPRFTPTPTNSNTNSTSTPPSPSTQRIFPRVVPRDFSTFGRNRVITRAASFGDGASHRGSRLSAFSSREQESVTPRASQHNVASTSRSRIPNLSLSLSRQSPATVAPSSSSDSNKTTQSPPGSPANTSSSLDEPSSTTPPRARLRPLQVDSPQSYDRGTPPSSYFKTRSPASGASGSGDTFGVGSPSVSNSISMSSSSEQSHSRSHSYGHGQSVDERPPPMPPLDHPALLKRGASIGGRLEGGTFPRLSRTASAAGKEREMGTFSAFSFGGLGKTSLGDMRGKDANPRTATDTTIQENNNDTNETARTTTRREHLNEPRHMEEGAFLRDSGFQEWSTSNERNRVASLTGNVSKGDRASRTSRERKRSKSTDRSRSLSRERGIRTPGRRSSADWSAREAMGNNTKKSWPAEVSREMLRLSFGNASITPTNIGSGVDGGTDGGGGGRLAATAGDIDRARVDNVGDPLARNLPLSGHQFSSSISSSFVSASLRSPFSLQGDVENNLSAHTRSAHFSTQDLGKEQITSMPHHDTNTNTTAESSKPILKPTKSSSSPSPPEPSSRSSSRPNTGNAAGPSSSSTRPSQGLLQPPNVQFSTPTPKTTSRRYASEPSPSGFAAPDTPLAGKGKRKAEDVEITPPDKKEQRATFALPDPRPHRASGTSGSSHAPSSYGRKRAKLSTSTPLTTPPATPKSTVKGRDNDPEYFGSWSSRASSSRPGIPLRSPSRVSRTSTNNVRAPRSSMSAASIPISALVSPHAPSIAHSGAFHMRDPHKPPRRQPTGWALHFANPKEPGSGSPLHAWMFFLGFVLFPLWWVASVWGIPRTRHVGGSDVEKAVTLDDPQVEHDAKSWRFRCRVMAGISLVTYVPFIVLVAIFAHR